MITKLLAIAGNTFLETIRQPIYNILMWSAIFWVAFVGPPLAGYSLDTDRDINVYMDISLATLLLYGLLASVFSAAGVITREIETQTVLTVVSKPVSRVTFLLGKYAGVIAAIFVSYYIVSLAMFFATRHGTMPTAADPYDQPVWVFGAGGALLGLLIAGFANYFYGWNFFTTTLAAWCPIATFGMLVVLFFDHGWTFQPPTTDFGDLQLIYAVIMMFFGVVVLTAFAVVLSTRFGQTATLLLCSGVLMAGLLSDYYTGAQREAAPVFQVLYSILPNMQFFWVGQALTQDQTIQVSLVAATAAYAGLYTAAVLSFGVALFQTREVG